MKIGKTPRILFLFSDTGGGHRSSSEAIIEGLQMEYDDQITTEMIDFLRHYYPWPYSKLPEMYREVVKYPRLYGAFWHTTNTPLRTRLLMDTNRLNLLLHWQHERLLREHPADLVVLTHYMAIPPMMWLPPAERPRTVVIVTDLVSTHATWFHPEVDYYIVPTPEAYEHALSYGIPANRISLVGLPVADRFCTVTATREEIRTRYGWPQDKPLVLLIGGAEGMGPLEENARAIAESGLDLGLIIVTGRNKRLKQQLEAMEWPVPTFVYGFVREMPEYMRASDALVTKAGPSTICEGLNSGLPIVLFDRLPGQEEGNVTYLADGAAGAYAPEPAQVVATISEWFSDPAKLAAAKAASTRLARPEAAREIAHILAGMVGVGEAGSVLDKSYSRTPKKRSRLGAAQLRTLRR